MAQENVSEAKEVELVTVRLRFNEDLPSFPPRANLLRGAVCRWYPEEGLLHQHEEGRTAYRYPQVQFRWRDGRGWIIGVGEGAHLVLRLQLLRRLLVLGEYVRRVEQVDIETRLVRLEESEWEERYRLWSPLLLFNQERYRDYLGMDEEGQQHERDRLLRSQMLMMLKGLGVWIDWELGARLQVEREVYVTHKGVKMLGFMGEVQTNLKMPSHLAAGRSISHGFGWMVSVEDL
ncbi:hypothetical protein L6R29_05815 [Myxococcota bacterium]|nr:hypothetical protein [Myxococcota bacterium]